MVGLTETFISADWLLCLQPDVASTLAPVRHGHASARCNVRTNATQRMPTTFSLRSFTFSQQMCQSSGDVDAASGGMPV